MTHCPIQTLDSSQIIESSASKWVERHFKPFGSTGEHSIMGKETWIIGWHLGKVKPSLPGMLKMSLCNCTHSVQPWVTMLGSNHSWMISCLSMIANDPPLHDSVWHCWILYLISQLNGQCLFGKLWHLKGCRMFQLVWSQQHVHILY